MPLIPNNHQRGFNLIEVTIALGFLAIVLVPLSEMYLSGYEGTDDVGDFDQAFNLAQDMMEEITSKSFEDPTAGAGSFGTEEASRINFDDVDDYDGYGPNTPPLDINGNAMNEYEGITRSVAVTNVVDVSAVNIPRVNLAAQADGSTDFKYVVVTISWDSGLQSETFERIVSNYQQ